MGFGPSGITKGEKAIRKAAWICTPVSASSTSQVMTNVQDLGKDLLTGNFPMDMDIAKLLISDDAAKKLSVKLSILQRTIKLDTTVEANPFGDDSAVASLIASLLSRCISRVPVAPSVPSLRSSHDGVAHCVVSLALRTACACGAVSSLVSLVT